MNKVVKDESLLAELNKLFAFNLVDLSDNRIYTCNSDSWNGELSRFFLEIIFKEFDVFLSNLSFKYRLNLLREESFCQLKRIFLFKTSLPVKLNQCLFKFGSLRSFFNYRIQKLEKLFVENLSKGEFFLKLRFLDYLLLGVNGRKGFVLNISNKISNFIRSRIHFDIEKLESFSCKDNFVFFAGFNIRLCFVSFICMLYQCFK